MKAPRHPPQPSAALAAHGITGRLRRTRARLFAPPAVSTLAIALAALAFSPIVGRAEPEPGDSIAALKKLSLDELLDVDVTSVSRRKQKLSAAPSAIQAITNDDIRRSGASSIPEALRLATNLAVAQRDSWQWAISARGFNSTTSNKLLVMIDGRTVYTPLYAGVFWDAQDTLLEDIDRVEVVSGPGATLWGANAVNGVINVVTKSARDTQGLLLFGGGGTELRGFGGVRYGGQIAPNLHYRIYAKYSDRDSSVRLNGTDAENDWQMGQSGFRLDWQSSDTDLITVQGDLYASRINQPGADNTEASGANLLTRWTRTFSDESDLQLQWYYDRSNRDFANLIEEDLDIYDLDFQHRFPFGERHDIVWGLAYRLMDDRVENTRNLAFLPANVTREWYSAFVQDEIALQPDRLHLTLGSKFEHNEYTGWEIQPSARLAWQLTETHMVWGAASRAMRTPSRIDREFYSWAGNSLTPVFVGGPGFDSEELIAYELGYRLQPLSQLSISISGFYHDYNDLRSVERVVPAAPIPLMLDNGLAGNSHGAELTVDYRPAGWWRLRGGFTRQLIHLHKKPGSTDMSNGSTESQDTNHIFSVRSSWDLPGAVELDATYRHIGRIEVQGVPAYGELDVRVGWRPTPALELSLVGQSLLHSEHAEFGSANSRQEIERAVYGKVVWLH